MFPRVVISTLLSVVWLISDVGPSNAAVTAGQRAKLNELVESTRVAGRLYTEGKYVECANIVARVQMELVELLVSKDATLQRLAKPVYTRLGRAHALLELEGAELEPLPSWNDLTRDQGMKPPPVADLVSFKEDIAPWFIAMCGNCHVNNRRGQFSLATYNDLLRGAAGNVVLFQGSAGGSRIVEVIETGDMPRGGGEVTPEQLASLKTWIDQGAKFDGPDPDSQLSSFVVGVRSPSTTRSTVNKATGNESVSFARDVAPILLENCSGCHIAGRRASGNLRMDTFDQLLRGGDSGELIAGSNANDSLLIKKLRGQDGQRMPAGGRPPLAEDQLAMIATWIREGATFDGPSSSTNLDVVVNQGWASKADHEELFQRRQQRARDRWTRVLPNDQPAEGIGDEVFVLGNVTPERIHKTVKQVGDAIQQVKKLLKAPAREPLVKGGIAVFMLKSRYDYSEFGRMTENRELPKEWLGHWQADPLDVYVVLAGESDIEQKQASAIAVQVVAGAYLGGFAEVPTWFAEGVARNLVVTAFRRGDDRVTVWQRSLPSAMQKVENARTLLENRLDEEAAGLVGMAMASFMMERSNRRRFDKLLELLREGRSFTDAATFAFAPPEAMLKAWLRK